MAVRDPILWDRDGIGWRRAGAMLSCAAKERGDRMMIVVGRLRVAPLVMWQAICLLLLIVLFGELDWGGGLGDIVRNMIFGHPGVTMAIAAVLVAWAAVLGKWRQRGAYVRHDGQWLYRGSAISWPLVAIRDVIVTRGALGLHSLRLVVEDDSETTRELVKLYMLDGPPEAVRDAVLFAAARAGGLPGSVTVH
jgi:hypothetical protein